MSNVHIWDPSCERRQLVGLLVWAAACQLSASDASASAVTSAGSVAGIEIGVSRFEDARGVLGPGAVAQNGGEGGSFRRHLCYQGMDGTTLVLTAYDWDSYIEEIQVVAASDEPEFGVPSRGYRAPPALRPKCGSSGRVARGEPVGALRLGMSRQAVATQLGSQKSASGRAAEYVHDGYWIEVSLTKDKVSRIRVARWRE